MKKLSCSDSDVPSGEETPSRAGLSYVPKARSDPLERDPFRLGGGSRPAVRECGVLCVSGGESIALGGERVLRSELLETAVCHGRGRRALSRPYRLVENTGCWTCLFSTTEEDACQDQKRKKDKSAK